jgi:hypothetical protein
MGRKSRRSVTSKKPDEQPKLLAIWQRFFLWAMWLAILALLWRNTSGEGFTFLEFLAMAAGTGITVWMCKHPTGRPKVYIVEAAEMRGRFESRTNWALVILAAHITLLGIAVAGKIVYDLSHGLTTVGGIFEDIAMFFLESLKITLSRGTAGDVTNTKLYTLIVALPIGPLMLMVVLVPWTHRGVPFRVEPGDLVEVRRDGKWQMLNVRDFPRVVANALNISFYADDESEEPVLQLPLSRVYSAELGTRVKAPVIAGYFRLRLEKEGYSVKPREGRPTTHESWVAQRPASGAPPSTPA